MKADDEERYAAFLAQQQNVREQENPLLQVRTMRTRQLLACDLEKRREMAQMLEQSGQDGERD